MTQKQILLNKIKATQENILKAIFIYEKNNTIKECRIEAVPEEFDYVMVFSDNYIFVPRCFNGNWWYEIIPRKPEIVMKENKISYIEG